MCGWNIAMFSSIQFQVLEGPHQLSLLWFHTPDMDTVLYTLEKLQHDIVAC